MLELDCEGEPERELRVTIRPRAYGMLRATLDYPREQGPRVRRLIAELLRDERADDAPAREEEKPR